LQQSDKEKGKNNKPIKGEKITFNYKQKVHLQNNYKQFASAWISEGK